ncbi:hypothetical protein GUITHDRAFT_162898 [Guillardia theta CCMP2712]|uniref:Deoxyribodipyrimidine photo-lyase n=1 Tax=Guillardia theta (strain CCMP2712) TaxID=905079 RepID=L1JDR5_GUITC|nr:hypothetical protein GUITHDRAFT_162898 [Guillardia theta CCMP2712]EKX46678.1 hypothetical protein GUITHDRAFT_162898 [Guillardia theta CCMP2712]|eukprot:XP_005833658.1 hypothetical protein GUITHDRAFT_162898 [Guillardia theta CCMP2712]
MPVSVQLLEALDDACKEEDQEKICDVLDRLQETDLDVDFIVKHVGKKVKLLRTHSSAEVKKKAVALTQFWKEVVKKKVESSGKGKGRAAVKVKEEEVKQEVDNAAKIGKDSIERSGKIAVLPERTRAINHKNVESCPKGKPVVYWMSRDQRVQDNWAMLYAQQQALEAGAPLAVCFNLVDSFLGAGLRQFGFMLRGLKEVEEELKELNIPFFLLRGDCVKTIPKFVKDNNVGLVVPVWVASDKQEVGARTLRPKIHRLLPKFHQNFPAVMSHPHPWKTSPPPTDFEAALKSLKCDESIPEVTWAKPGSAAGLENLSKFLMQKFKNFNTKRNDPSEEVLSDMSPWLHFGQVAPARCALEAKSFSKMHSESYASYIEELVVRRELSDNFCHYNKKYDSLEGCAGWAQETLKVHAGDKRPHVYSLAKLEEAKTHDDLWNAAQLELVHRGKMHGFMRMYWAKKILEWTSSPEEALKFAILLNDKYNLDGRDPNGFVGCMWSIGGVHDMG